MASNRLFRSGFSHSVLSPLILGFVVTLAPVSDARAEVVLEKLAEFEDFEPGGISHIGDVALDAGRVALAFVRFGELPGIGFYTGPDVGQIVSVVDNTTVPPGFSTPCWYPRFARMSAGRIFFQCTSGGTDPGMDGVYVWSDGRVTTLINRAEGVPGCEGPLLGFWFGIDWSDVSAGRVLVSSIVAGETCSSVSMAGPAGVESVFDTGSAFPAEFGMPWSIAGVALEGTSAASVWTSTEYEDAIFVDRGQGLEMWATTGSSSSEFHHWSADLGPRIRFSGGRLAFEYEFTTGPNVETRYGLALADGALVEFVVDTATLAPGTQDVFRGEFRRWTHTARGMAFEAATAGNAFPGIYIWADGVLSPIATPGMILPGSDSPIEYASDLAASDDLIIFWVRHLDGSASVYADDDGESILVASTRDPIDGHAPVLFDLADDAGVDGRQLVFKMYSQTSKPALYLATVGRPVPAMSTPAMLLLATVLGYVGVVRAGSTATRARRRLGRIVDHGRASRW